MLLCITFLSFSFLPEAVMIKICSLCLDIESKLMIQLEEVLSLAGGRYQHLLVKDNSVAFLITATRTHIAVGGSF
jgi:hypothetical protein